MKITEVPHGLDLSKPTEGYIRTPGLHMSDIYGALYADLEPARYGKNGPFGHTRMAFGTVFEQVLEIAFAHHFLGERPGELACLPDARIVPLGTPNSIIFSPDQLFFDRVTIGGEFKATKMTSRHGIQDARFDKYFCQMKAYGKPMQVRLWHLFVLFINGDYSFAKDDPDGGMDLKKFEIEFTQRELDDNWNMLMRYARKKGMLI